MRILHYSLGFPPYRRGGLTKYCLDLMAAQEMQGNVVAMCWPGEIGVFKKKKVAIKKRRNYNIGKSKIENYEIQGILPVPLLEGIKNPNLFIEKKNPEIWKQFLKNWRPDVIHFHTLMGLPLEYVETAGNLGIKTVFTTHDYFGLCPRTTLVRQNGEICDGCTPELCSECCENAISYRKLKILQSSVYRVLKDSVIVKKLRKKHWNESKNDSAQQQVSVQSAKRTEEYVELRKYYIKLLKSFNIIHFNSSNTRDVYLKAAKEMLNNKVVSISHEMIKDNKKIKKKHDILHFSYMGPDTYNKGYYVLKETLDQLYKEGYKFQLNIYFEDASEPFIVSHAPYQYSELGKVMDDADCVILPSLWNETFGFTVLEALSYGVPVIVSSHVGAKDIVDEGKNGFVVEGNVDSLKTKLRSVLDKPEILEDMNNYIVANTHIKTMTEHSKEIKDLYQK